MTIRTGFLCLLLALSAIAHAEPSIPNQQLRELARKHYRQGSTAYAKGQYPLAITEFQEAYRIFPLPDILFNLAQAHRMNGERAVAINFYRRYLEAQPTGIAADEAHGHIATLTAEEKRDEERRRFEKEQLAIAERRMAEEQKTRAIAQETERRYQQLAVQLAPPRVPTYKKWWVWTTVGIVVAGGVGLGVGLGLGLNQNGQPSTPLGTAEVFR